MIKNRDSVEPVDFDQQCFKLDKIHCNLIKTALTTTPTASSKCQNDAPIVNGSPSNSGSGSGSSSGSGSGSAGSSGTGSASTGGGNASQQPNCADCKAPPSTTEAPIAATEVSSPVTATAAASGAELKQANGADEPAAKRSCAKCEQPAKMAEEQLAEQQPAQQPRPIRPLVFCGPSGSGKSTMLKKLLREYDGCFGFSISRA